MTDLSATIVLLGVDGESKPHAARFEPRHYAAALRAATLMGLRAVTVGDDPDVQKAASQLPHGKIFATGRGLVPLVKRAIYDKLAALLGTDRELKPDASNDGSDANELPKDAAMPPAQIAPATSSSEGPNEPVTPPVNPTKADWDALAVGSLVLGKSRVPDEGWFEAFIVAVATDSDELTLRYRDFPTEPKLTVKRQDVGLLFSK